MSENGRNHENGFDLREPAKQEPVYTEESGQDSAERTEGLRNGQEVHAQKEEKDGHSDKEHVPEGGEEYYPDGEGYYLDEDEDDYLDEEDYYLDDEEDYYLDDDEDDYLNNGKEDRVKTGEDGYPWEKDRFHSGKDSGSDVRAEEDQTLKGKDGGAQEQRVMKKEAEKKKSGSGKTASNVKRSGAEKTEPQKTETKKSNYKEKSTGKRRSGRRTALIAVGIILTAAAAAYLGVSVFFMSHFYINTEINGHDFSARTVEDVKTFMEGEVQDYELTILEKDNKTDTIRGEDISLEYKENKDIEKALERQNAFLWPQAFFMKNSAKVTIEVSYDKEALDTLIGNLQSVKAEQIPATSAYPRFDGEQFVVEPEVTGTAVEMEVLNEKIKDHISEFQPELDMQEEGCYALPQYTSDSPEVIAACEEMNTYLRASITYSMDVPVVVDRALISGWVTADENLQVTFHEDQVRAWLAEFGKQYDTVGTTRTITSPQGRTVEVSGGTYGWGVDEDTEFVALVESIKKGEVLTKEPAYCIGQTAASHGPQDWGSTYAEVDLTTQHMWYIVDGAVVMDSDVVTGVPIPERQTPAGVYNILEKALNKTLVGEEDPETGEPEYETPVDFWMRVTWSGIGFHDAIWQPGFGGTMYADGYGSHGCINMPYDAAATLYNMMPEFTPVIIHY